MDEKALKTTSKFLSLVLRHQPEAIGITLDEQGWTNVAALMTKLQQHNFPITLEQLKVLVETNAKKRFAFNEDFSSIRASQGHSVSIELGYNPAIPPAVLYHGTGQQSIASIQETGLDKRERHHVHLSADRETALNVGQRHGKPCIFEVAAAQMQQEGFTFFQSDNGVWLTDHVPVRYLQLIFPG
ncbi:MAG: RNA 2'-phosphotransferase [Candidatus Pseudobacter hemicellulosilyticus]|uniref:Probable RNA 2'-phosphotransferase n=1 Tax=Candidatus Pseudobacter hemicellulosilyticus TaxID=3121375 RepID=A0AAJ5WX16_9BACT|nr:MAG: RNA 2'-phosphotransferase [Pseudobacter sp.]